VAGRMDGDTQFDVDTLVLKVFPDGSPWIAYKYNSSDIEEGYDLRAVVGAPQVAVKEYVTGNLRVCIRGGAGPPSPRDRHTINTGYGNSYSHNLS